MRGDVWISTVNYQRAEAICEELLGSSQERQMAAIIGLSGCGKTTTAHKIFTMNSSTMYVSYAPWQSPAGVVREICFMATGTRPTRMGDCVQLIENEMRRSRRLLLLDEADLMSNKHFEVLRVLHDRIHSPIVFLGEEPLQARISAERRLSRRVVDRLVFESMTQADLILYYGQALDLKLATHHAAQLTRHSVGLFGQMVHDAQDVEKYMRANGLTELTDEVVRLVCAKPVQPVSGNPAQRGDGRRSS
jgi:DNA transposition AAA+ family ATPase